MIKINLLQVIERGGAHAPGGADGDHSAESTDVLIKAGFARIAMILVVPALLFAWETINISNKKSEINKLVGEMSAIRAENEKSGNLSAEIEKFIKEKNALENQIKMIEKLSRGRTRVVHVLETISKMMPAKAWVNQLKFGVDKLEVGGSAWSNQEISEFTSRLEQSVYFRNVELKSVNEGPFRGGTVKMFLIDTSLEGE